MLRALSAGLLLGVTSIYSVTWGPGSGDVINTNLVISGNVQLGLGATGNHIQAITADVNVTMTAASVIKGNNAGPSQLYLFAAAGHSITFNVTRDLTFEGSSSLGLPNLLIVQSGPGTVNWIIDGGVTLSYTAGLGTGGTEYWLYEAASAPLARFSRNTSVLPASNIFVNVGPSSIISYLSNFASPFAGGDSARILVNSANANANGNFAFNIEDTGGIVIAGHYSNQPNPLLVTSANIFREIAAGSNAIFEVENTLGETINGNHGLWVLNRNATFSADVNGQQGNWLVDPFLVLCARNDPNYTGTFSGVRYGWTLGANGTLTIDNDAFINYVGLNIDVTPSIFSNGCIDFQGPTNQAIKKRNPSAFIVDGNLNPFSTAAQLNLGDRSALFFRSGVNSNNVVENDLTSTDPFVIDPVLRSPDAGNVVFAIEGELNVSGVSALDSKLELLSWEVDQGTGALFVGGTETIFPKRTFAKDGNNVYLQYNAGKFLVNNYLNLFETSLSHTDENHIVVTKNSCISEPAYVGGETFTLLPLALPTPIVVNPLTDRPKITFLDARFLLNTDVAITGLDLLVPNGCLTNLSTFVFYYNGYAVDNGFGRNLILGTHVGSTAAGCSREISDSAHLDIIQTSSCIFSRAAIPGHELDLTVAANDNTINPLITGPITGQVSTHSIYLNAVSNISIGENSDTISFSPVTYPWLRIAGNSFSFDTGAPQPQNVGVTGLGGIFVDLNGQFTIDPQLSATINTMVVRSRNAYVDLPITEVFFHNGVGITAWQPDMSESILVNPTSGRVLVSASESFLDFSLNWALQVIKDPSFVPFPVVTALDCSPVPTVTSATLDYLPEIQGTVNQLQIQGSRFSDPATIKINGGHVEELVFLEGCLPGEYNGAVIVLQNGGTCGIGSVNRNFDSAKAATVLGRNGVVFIVDAGGGKIVLNNSVDILGSCAFLVGPGFDPETDLFEIEATVPYEMIVRKGGILDLRGIPFGTTLSLKQYAQLSFEPATIAIFGGGTLEFTDNSELRFLPSLESDVYNFFNAIPLGPINDLLPANVNTLASAPHNEFASLTGYGAGLHNTDPFRVRLVGTGIIAMTDDSVGEIPHDTFVGVETLNYDDPSCGFVTVSSTNIILSLSGNAQFFMGRDSSNVHGGVLQIGNVEDLEDNSITFLFELNGESAKFFQGATSFFGLNVGVVRAGVPTMNQYLVNTLFNVSSIEFDFFNGEWAHNRIFSGDNINASLVAIGEGPIYTATFGAEIGALFDITNNDTNINGGGNLVYITAGTAGNDGAIAPIVRDQDDFVTVDTTTGETSDRLRVSIMSSLIMRQHEINLINVSGLDLFTDWKAYDATARQVTEIINGTAIVNKNINGRAETGPTGESAFRGSFQQIQLGAVVIPDSATTLKGGTPTIIRQEISTNAIQSGRGGGGSSGSNGQEVLDIGAVSVVFNAARDAIIFVTDLF